MGQNLLLVEDAPTRPSILGGFMKTGSTGALGPKRSPEQKYGKLTGMAKGPSGGKGTVKKVARPGAPQQKYTTSVQAGTGYTARPGGSQKKGPAGGSGTVARPGGLQPAHGKSTN